MLELLNIKLYENNVSIASLKAVKEEIEALATAEEEVQTVIDAPAVLQHQMALMEIK